MSSRRNSARMTRRQWTALLSAVPLAAQVTTTVPPVGSPEPAPVTATPQEKLQKANEDIRRVSERLAAIELPMDVEPAFSFKV